MGAKVWVVASAPVVAVALEAPRGAAFVAMLAYHLGCVLASRGMRWGRRPAIRDLALWCLASAALVLASAAAARALVPSLAVAPGIWRLWGLGEGRDAVFLLWYAVANPWIEEGFWRATLVGRALPEGMRRACIWSVVGFAPMHAVVLVASFGARLGGLLAVAVVAAGLAWTLLYARRGEAWTPAASHAGADLGLALAYGLWLS